MRRAETNDGHPEGRPCPRFPGGPGLDVEIVRANGLAAVLGRAARRRLDVLIDDVVETVGRVARGVAAGIPDHLLDLRRDEQHLLRTATAARLTLLCFGHLASPAWFEANLFYTALLRREVQVARKTELRVVSW